MQAIPPGLKIISPKTHGMLDYMTAGTFLALPRMLGWSERPTRLLSGAGAAVLGMTMLTQHPLGLVRVVPMTIHLALDGLLFPGLLGAQFRMRNEGTGIRGMLGVIALLGMLTTVMTRTQP